MNSSPRTPRSPRSPRTPRTPRTPRSPRSPATPRKNRSRSKRYSTTPSSSVKRTKYGNAGKKKYQPKRYTKNNNNITNKSLTYLRHLFYNNRDKYEISKNELTDPEKKYKTYSLIKYCYENMALLDDPTKASLHLVFVHLQEDARTGEKKYKQNVTYAELTFDLLVAFQPAYKQYIKEPDNEMYNKYKK
jgi:hypothetical protein